MKRVLTTSALASALLVAGSAHASDPGESTGSRYSFFGLDVCVGDLAADAECDVELPALKKEASPRPKDTETYAGVFNVLGKSVCVGAVDQSHACWIRVPTKKPETDTRGT